jgi:hypothetical protein
MSGLQQSRLVDTYYYPPPDLSQNPEFEMRRPNGHFWAGEDRFWRRGLIVESRASPKTQSGSLYAHFWAEPLTNTAPQAHSNLSRFVYYMEYIRVMLFIILIDGKARALKARSCKALSFLYQNCKFQQHSHTRMVINVPLSTVN